ncbi:protein-L-isoaspartate O-methyltransferase [Pisolithus croceorrhizus]|nr:protein-L-isoaspartate O-methyltransferase [Pisolithus croceorrhizus]KAI6149095.1 protein-L-isoaspartate O-methyltransferase [Pisolithus thermaeus]
MAWRCSGRSNSDLIRNMARQGIITSDRVSDAMAKVDRVNYVQRPGDAYQDSPQSIGHGATISAPHMHAHALENLLPYIRPGATVLDVGSGSGYLAAVLHHLVSPAPSPDNPNPPQGKVIGIDHIPELVGWSKHNLERDGLGAALQDGRIEMIVGDGRQGYIPAAPYDAIHVGAAAPTLPQALVDQLNAPGKMFIPVGIYSQSIWEVEKTVTGQVRKRELMGVMYVPLTDPDRQRNGA